uniref:Uncharacterized protein n=2 Tax=viral metagenome TaxID=1070528 RepID=A0A6M3KW47_9ZZZZ
MNDNAKFISRYEEYLFSTVRSQQDTFSPFRLDIYDLYNKIIDRLCRPIWRTTDTLQQWNRGQEY